MIEATNPGTCAGGIWLDNEARIDSHSPSNDQVIASVSECDDKQYEKVVQAAKTAFLQWRQVPAPKRGEIIHLLGEKLRKNKQTLAELITLEMGKPIQEALGEVQEMIDMADFAVGQSRMLYGNTLHSERPDHRMYEQWHPLGIVGIITAFNFPMAVWAWNAMLAIICGNSVIWKPSPKTPLCCITIQHICNEVMRESKSPGIFSCFVTSQDRIAQQFAADTRIPLISFTGSSAVGTVINEIVAKRMGRCLLECSGNNAVIVDADANLDLAIPSIVFGAIGTSGQRCTTTRRVIAHQSIRNQLKKSLLSAYEAIKIGDPMKEENLMGPLIDRDAVNHYLTAIEAIQRENGEIVYGGNRINQPGFYVEPTLVEANNDWDIVQHETFAPILYILSYTEMEEAITLQNSVSQGLSSALFTNTVQHAELFLSSRGSDCGIANINIGTSGAEIGGAFGGEKMTGGGRETGSDAWKSYMRRQTNTINWSDDLPLAQGIQFHIKPS